jgi:3-deoxy-D-manno-octulosonate 8-phosphate phosphatase KdsC-like HAD superfamily phosphatase
MLNLAVHKLIARLSQVKYVGDDVGDFGLLTFQSVAVSLLTTRFKVQKFHMVLALR